MSNVRCQCGLEFEPKPPAIWCGVDELHRQMTQFHCPAGHPVMLALDTMRPYTADRSMEYPPKRGEYFKGEQPTGAFQFCCPVCKQIFGMAAHNVDNNGKVDPSIICPGGCGFHAWVTFKDYSPHGASHD